MKYILLILMVGSYQAQAQANKFILKTSNIKGLKRVDVDLNRDAKADRIETYRGKSLVFLDRDTKFTGKFDQKTTYLEFVSATKPIEITTLDTNGDGKVDRIESVYQDKIHDLLIVSTKVDSKFKGVFEKKFTTHSKLSQEKEDADCIVDQRLQDLKILKLTKDITDLKILLQDGFYQTDWGYRIHESCLDKWGAETFPALLKASMSKGFQCLGNLAKENAKKNLVPNGALDNLQGLEYLISKNNVSIVCNEKDYSWEGFTAHASTIPNEMIKESGVRHPFISVNEFKPKIKGKPSEDEKNALSGTLFHEQFHNLGILHNKNIEFPYACVACCVSLKTTESEKEIACKICSGVYTSASEKNYINDLITWGKNSSNKSVSRQAIISYQKEFPGDRWALFAYADASTSLFSPVGIQLAKILKNKFKNITQEEESYLKNIEYYGVMPNLTNKVIAGFSKVLAEAHITQYFDGDTKKTLENLEKNKVAIKELLKKLSETTDESKYILEEIKDKYDNLLSDIWRDGYPKNNSAENDRAYKVLLETGLLK